MLGVLARVRWLAFCVAALMFGGCATLPTPGTRLDVEALGNAIVADHVAYVRAAVEARVATVNERVPAPVYMEGTPLITIAARAGAVEVMRYLIGAGADLNARTPAGETAMMLAAYFRGEGAEVERHERIVRMLAEAGAVLENEPYHYTPLAYAAYRGHDHIIRYLIKRGAQVDAGASPGDAYVNTPLMMAAMQGNQSSAVLLLRAGADARIRVQNGHTAAELATKYRAHDLVPMLRCAEQAGPGGRFLQLCEAGRR